MLIGDRIGMAFLLRACYLMISAVFLVAQASSKKFNQSPSNSQTRSFNFLGMIVASLLCVILLIIFGVLHSWWRRRRWFKGEGWRRARALCCCWWNNNWGSSLRRRQSNIDMSYKVNYRRGEVRRHSETSNGEIQVLTAAGKEFTKESPLVSRRGDFDIMRTEASEFESVNISMEVLGEIHEKTNTSTHDAQEVDTSMVDHDSFAESEALVPVSRFLELVNFMKEDGGSFEAEWANLSDPNPGSQAAARKEENFKKNRYKNILPYDHSRVMLEPIDGIPNTDYINASYLHSTSSGTSYIASQGPNATSVSDFWRMIWQEKVQTIVMVTNLVEKNKIKCEKYWPNVGDSSCYDSITVICESEDYGIHDVKRKFVIEKDYETREVAQFHFIKWPDKGVPRNVSIILHFIDEVKRSRAEEVTPLLVHCSAGVGRTGVVIALDNEMERVKNEQCVDIFNFVKSMRRRRPQMVQTPEQYEFIHDAILEFIVCPNTLMSRDQLYHRICKLADVDEATGETVLEKEFEILNIVSHKPPADATNIGALAENTQKNRYQNVIPRDSHRPLLMSRTDSSMSYINATFCQAYEDRERIITTQMPLPTTVMDFLSLVYDYHINTIVMLNDISHEQALSHYWDETNPYISPPFSVEVMDTLESEHWTERTLELKHRRDTRVVQQLHFTSWNSLESNEFCHNLLEFINHVTVQREDNSPVLVHCLNGIGRTGIYCVMKMCLDQLDAEDGVDVFQIVKTLRHDNHQMIQDVVDYKLCYCILKCLMTPTHKQVDKENTLTGGFANIDYSLDCVASPFVTDGRSECTDIDDRISYIQDYDEEEDVWNDEDDDGFVKDAVGTSDSRSEMDGVEGSGAMKYQRFDASDYNDAVNRDAIEVSLADECVEPDEVHEL